MSQGVEFSKQGNVAFLTLNRPPANGFDHPLMHEMGTAVETAAEDEQIRAVIVRSALGRFFSAGADIRGFSEATPEQTMQIMRSGHSVLRRMTCIPKIFIAQISGHALGGGLEVALACDLRFGAEGSYQIGLPEVNLGILPGWGGTQRLPRLIGSSRALDLMTTGRRLPPAEAHGLGLLDYLHPADELEAKTLAYAEALARGASRAIGSIKLAVHGGLAGPMEEGLALEREVMEGLLSSQDAREGFRAFLEKRAPRFEGR